MQYSNRNQGAYSKDNIKKTYEYTHVDITRPLRRAKLYSHRKIRRRHIIS